MFHRRSSPSAAHDDGVLLLLLLLLLAHHLATSPRRRSRRCIACCWPRRPCDVAAPGRYPHPRCCVQRARNAAAAIAAAAVVGCRAESVGAVWGKVARARPPDDERRPRRAGPRPTAAPRAGRVGAVQSVRAEGRTAPAQPRRGPQCPAPPCLGIVEARAPRGRSSRRRAATTTVHGRTHTTQHPTPRRTQAISHHTTRHAASQQSRSVAIAQGAHERRQPARHCPASSSESVALGHM